MQNTEFTTGQIRPIECVKEAWALIKDEYWLLELSNGALSSLQFDAAQVADVSLTLSRPTLEAILQQRLPPMQAITAG